MRAPPRNGAKEEVMLSSRFRDPDRRLFFARAMLFPNRIEFSGLALTGMYHRMLMLENVEQVEWKVGQVKAANLTIWMRDGDKIQVWMNGAGLWKYMIDANVRSLSRQLPESSSTRPDDGTSPHGEA